MLEGNLVDFIEVLTDDELRLLVVFVQVEMDLPNVHAGSVFFVNRKALSDKIDAFCQKASSDSFKWSKLYVGVADLIQGDKGKLMLKEIQRTIERRSYSVNRNKKHKQRKFVLSLYKDNQLYTSYRCKTNQLAQYRGSFWAMGKRVPHDQGRAGGGTLEREASHEVSGTPA